MRRDCTTHVFGGYARDFDPTAARRPVAGCLSNCKAVRTSHPFAGSYRDAMGTERLVEWYLGASMIGVVAYIALVGFGRFA
jgi:hypothetical protein